MDQILNLMKNVLLTVIFTLFILSTFSCKKDCSEDTNQDAGVIQDEMVQALQGDWKQFYSEYYNCTDSIFYEGVSEDPNCILLPPLSAALLDIASDLALALGNDSLIIDACLEIDYRFSNEALLISSKLNYLYVAQDSLANYHSIGKYDYHIWDNQIIICASGGVCATSDFELEDNQLILKTPDNDNPTTICHSISKFERQ